MPTYTYKCTNPLCSKLDEEFEVKHGMNEPSHRFCSKCGTNSLQKVIKSAAFRFDGPGFPGHDMKWQEKAK